MKRTLGAIALILAATTYAAPARQAQNGAGPRDDAYVSTHQPRVKLSDPNESIKDDPVGRRESFREQMGGDLTPEFMASLMAEGDAERAKYGPAGRGAIGVAGGATCQHWTVSVQLDSERAAGSGVRHRADTGVPRAPNKS